MTDEEFRDLETGDVIQHVTGHVSYIVHGNYGNRVTAVRTVDMTNPSEWGLVVKLRGERIRRGNVNRNG